MRSLARREDRPAFGGPGYNQVVEFKRCGFCVALSALLLIAVCAPANLYADECGPPPRLQVEAVCGQTLFGAGWRQPGHESDIFAEIIPGFALQILDAHGVVVAETKSGGEGLFMFKPVAAGDYVLHAAEPGFILHWPITVTGAYHTCAELVYVYPAVGGSSCRSRVTLSRPAEIKCSVLCKPTGR
jgi:hypothetical protein